MPSATITGIALDIATNSTAWIRIILGVIWLKCRYTHQISFRKKAMYKKEFGFLLGLLGIFLWFTPLIYLDVDKMKGSFFDGLVLYQTGHHIGGIAYLLLLSCAAYSYSSWLQHKFFAIASSVVTLLVCLSLAFSGGTLAWGLYTLIFISIISLGYAIMNHG